MNRAEELRERLHLIKHPEGGAFSEHYTSECCLPDGRPACGSIYFMLEGEEISHFHQIDCEELWYYHEGCGMQITLVDESGRVTRRVLGPDVSQGQEPMVLIPRGVVFGAENLSKDSYCLISCATAPHFRYEGFRLISYRWVQEHTGEQAESLRYLTDLAVEA